jgi:hypothetical protein
MPIQQPSASNKGKPTAQPRGKERQAAAAQATAERDEVYGLVSVLYHALQGAETYATYASDARRAGDDEVVEFFEDCRSDDTERAERAKELLAARLDVLQENGAGDEGDDEEE